MKKANIKFTLLIVISVLTGILAATSHDLIQNFQISPNPMDRVVHIALSFKEPVNVSVRIVDANESSVKNLFVGDVNRDLLLSWNRIGDNGFLLPSGRYEVVVSFQSRYTSTKKTLILR